MFSLFFWGGWFTTSRRPHHKCHDWSLGVLRQRYWRKTSIEDVTFKLVTVGAAAGMVVVHAIGNESVVIEGPNFVVSSATNDRGLFSFRKWS